MRNIAIFAIPFFVIGITSSDTFAADPIPWKWDAGAAELSHSILDVPTFYGVTIDIAADNHATTITVSDNKKHSVKWIGHVYSVFQIDQALDRVYYAAFNPTNCGAEIRCVDIVTGAEVWHSKLEAVGTVEHSKYTNRLNMVLTTNKNIIIYGNEDAGKYIEVLDCATGKQVSHAIIAKTQE